jgi:peptidyl-prolyl cis-trans isomerase A (cyclophilin A)
MRHDARLIARKFGWHQGRSPVASAPGFLGAALALCACLAARPASADTIVTFTTNLGTFDVQLYDSQVSTTVANFLSYVTARSYTNSIIQRSTTYNPTTIQIVQGGGFTLDGYQLTAIPTAAPIPLEAGLSNLKGTIAMARTGDPNSATSGWFLNVTDNPALDDGYTVFGEVIGDGISVIEAIGALGVYNVSGTLGPTFTELPLVADVLEPQNLVMVNSIVAVPEPGTLALALTAMLLASGFRKYWQTEA